MIRAKMAVIARRRLDEGAGKPLFYQAKLDTARFFMTRMLPETSSLAARIRAGAAPIMDFNDEAF